MNNFMPMNLKTEMQNSDANYPLPKLKQEISNLQRPILLKIVDL